MYCIIYILKNCLVFKEQVDISKAHWTYPSFIVFLARQTPLCPQEAQRILEEYDKEVAPRPG